MALELAKQGVLLSLITYDFVIFSVQFLPTNHNKMTIPYWLDVNACSS